MSKLSDKEVESLRFLARFMYLTLGYYGTPFNYSPEGICYHPITGEAASGIMHDGGHDARNAMERVDKSGLKDYIIDATNPLSLVLERNIDNWKAHVAKQVAQEMYSEAANMLPLQQAVAEVTRKVLDESVPTLVSLLMDGGQ